MAIPLIPWEPCNIPDEIQQELNRRKINRSFKFVEGSKGGWDKSDGDWNQYRGPMAPWVRLCSNGAGKIYKTNPRTGATEFDDNGNPIPLDSSEQKQGFVLFGGKDFYSGYGFSKVEGGPSVIGYVPDGTNRTHTISNDLKTSTYPIFVPPPEIERISVSIQKELYRRATIEWVCFSKAQLEYMTPYFLVPGISCILEWGWNHYDPRSLIDLTDLKRLKQLFNNPYSLYTDHILHSRGNYDVLIGIITNFEWSIESTKIKCKTEITSKDRIYAGLVIDAVAAEGETKKTESEQKTERLVKKQMDKLQQFVEKALPQFKAVNSSKNPATIPDLHEFVQYVANYHPNNWEEYVFGVFYGRDMEDKKTNLWEGRRDDDFDDKSHNAKTWLNLGLVMEAINFHSAPLTGMANEEMFRIDIDDVIISGHPNLISADWGVCLIPNAEAPKYFSGIYAYQAADYEKHKSDYDLLKNSSRLVLAKDLSPFSVAKKNGRLADRQLWRIAGGSLGAYRDDLDEVINKIRYNFLTKSKGANAPASNFEFPFLYDVELVNGSKPYPARYSGYLKNIYVTVEFLVETIKAGDCKTYPALIEKILAGISNACGGFWDFRLVGATGRDGLGRDGIATMKIVDYKFMATANRGSIYTLDYFDTDSLLLGLDFKPTLSNAQAIRTMYAPTNNQGKKIIITNGNDEVLNYQFSDRLRLDDEGKNLSPKVTVDRSGFEDTMRILQALAPPAGSCPFTCKDSNGRIIMRRLAIPPNASHILQLLLDDQDEENNPKYTGIMPGIQASFTVQGIGGLRTFMMFLVRNLPRPYSHKDIIFRIVDVKETLEAGKWITVITAGVIPLREHIKARLGIVFGKTS
jgi:hypothetical protein